jgi:hypothetical protein
MTTRDDYAARSSFLGILQLISQGLRDAKPLPDWLDSEAVRDWFFRLVPTVQKIAARTITTLDDSAAALVMSIVTCDSLWDPCWNAAQELVDPTLPGEISVPLMRAIADGCREADRNTGSIDPGAVMALVEIAADIAVVIISINQHTAPDKHTAPGSDTSDSE